MTLGLSRERYTWEVSWCFHADAMTCIHGNPLGSATFEPLSVAGALGIKDQGFLRFSGLVQIAVFVPHDSMTSVAGQFLSQNTFFHYEPENWEWEGLVLLSTEPLPQAFPGLELRVTLLCHPALV